METGKTIAIALLIIIALISIMLIIVGFVNKSKHDANADKLLISGFVLLCVFIIGSIIFFKLFA